MKSLETKDQRALRYRHEWDRELVPAIRRHIDALEQLQSEYRRLAYRRDSGAERTDQAHRLSDTVRSGQETAREIGQIQGRMQKLHRYLREHAKDDVPIVRAEWRKHYVWPADYTGE